MRALILCAGDGTRWDNYLGVPKQLAPVDGVPILHRTVRMLQDRGITDIRVVAKPDAGHLFTVDGAATEPARLDPDNFEADRFCSSRHLWSTTGRTLILYGDVYFSDDAMDLIVDDPEASGQWRAYGRPKGSKLTGCAHGELFAFSWQPSQHAEIDDRLSYVIGLRRDGTINRALGWELFRALCGRTGSDVRSPRGTPFQRLVKIDDWTDDFDKPKQYETWHYRRGGSRCNVAVLVPWRPDGGHRDAAWAWVADRWRRKHPDWQLVVGHCLDGPWSKGAAVADAFSRTDAPVLVIADADVWCGGVAYAVDKVAIGQAKWAIPHRLVHRLSQKATYDLLNGGMSYERIHRAPLVERPYVGYPGGGIAVVGRDLLARAPIDQRFLGWGHEDEAAALAWSTLGGKPWRGTADLWHLWHPPAVRRSRALGSSESVRLLQQYRRSSGNYATMAQLVEKTDMSQREDWPVIFVSDIPDLHVPAIRVRFTDGMAEVGSPGAIRYLGLPHMRRRGVRPATAEEQQAYMARSLGEDTAREMQDPPPKALPEDRTIADPSQKEQQTSDQQPPAPDGDTPGGGQDQTSPDSPDTGLEPPDGTAADILDWVGGDTSRAQAALAAEQARESPRVTLIRDLGKIG